MLPLSTRLHGPAMFKLLVQMRHQHNASPDMEKAVPHFQMGSFPLLIGEQFKGSTSCGALQMKTSRKSASQASGITHRQCFGSQQIQAEPKRHTILPTRPACRCGQSLPTGRTQPGGDRWHRGQMPEHPDNRSPWPFRALEWTSTG